MTCGATSPPGGSPRTRRRCIACFYRLTIAGRRNLDEIAGLITAIRDLHDDYLRDYEDAYPLQDAAAALV